MKITGFPTDQEIENADRLQLARWNRFLVVPTSMEEGRKLKKILTRFKALGGMSPEISKQLNW